MAAKGHLALKRRIAKDESFVQPIQFVCHCRYNRLYEEEEKQTKHCQRNFRRAGIKFCANEHKQALDIGVEARRCESQNGLAQA